MTNVTLHAPVGNPTAPGTNTITDDTVLGVTNKYYQLSNSTCCSRAIGFTRLILTPGTNLVADQLCQVDDGVMTLFDGNPIPDIGLTMNDLNGLFDVYPWATNMGQSSFFQWNGNGFDGDIDGNAGGQPSWAAGGNMTLLPGNSVIISNALGVSYPIWFTGLVRNQQIFSIEPGTNHLIPTTNYLSATIPVAGALTNITGYRPLAGDIIQL
jgi:hypothetical protein